MSFSHLSLDTFFLLKGSKMVGRVYPVWVYIIVVELLGSENCCL